MTEQIDRQYAELVLNAVFRASRELGEVRSVATAHCSEATAADLKEKIVVAMAEIGNVMEQVFKACPELRDTVEARLEKYGRWS